MTDMSPEAFEKWIQYEEKKKEAVLAEREACAKLADDVVKDAPWRGAHDYGEGARVAAGLIAEQIRARGKNK